MTPKHVLWMVCLILVLLSFCFSQKLFAVAKGGNPMKIESPQITEGNMIPSQYTCDGKDVSPPLEWRDFPAGTKSFALISDDPDAPVGTWVHWVLYNIPPDITRLEENIKPEKEFKNGMMQGSNSWPRIGYGGPCPPSGTHRYFFKLYALDTLLDLKPGVNKEQLLKAMAGHILAEAQLMGKYKRQRY
jgi:Raf kinase inhibitor-like YbhB/YbcL family protein